MYIIMYILFLKKKNLNSKEIPLYPLFLFFFLSYLLYLLLSFSLSLSLFFFFFFFFFPLFFFFFFFFLTFSLSLSLSLVFVCSFTNTKVDETLGSKSINVHAQHTPTFLVYPLFILLVLAGSISLTLCFSLS